MENNVADLLNNVAGFKTGDSTDYVTDIQYDEFEKPTNTFKEIIRNYTETNVKKYLILNPMANELFVPFLFQINQNFLPYEILILNRVASVSFPDLNVKP